MSTVAINAAAWTDDEAIDRILAGDSAVYELLIRRYNQRLYRVIRGILRSDTDVEDVTQEAYVRAYRNLSRFERRSSFATWLTRIAVNEALARLDRNRRLQPLDETTEVQDDRPRVQNSRTPESEAAAMQTRKLLEEAILGLPKHYRMVLMLRDVEEMSTAETADTLELTQEAVKVRLHRARALLRRELYARAGATSSAAFQFHASRCERVTAGVLARIRADRFGAEDEPR